jgi:hypothetical protein
LGIGGTIGCFANFINSQRNKPVFSSLSRTVLANVQIVAIKVHSLFISNENFSRTLDILVKIGTQYFRVF